MMFFQRVRVLLVACIVICSAVLVTQAAPAIEVAGNGEEVSGMFTSYTCQTVDYDMTPRLESLKADSPYRHCSNPLMGISSVSTCRIHAHTTKLTYLGQVL